MMLSLIVSNIISGAAADGDVALPSWLTKATPAGGAGGDFFERVFADHAPDLLDEDMRRDFEEAREAYTKFIDNVELEFEELSNQLEGNRFHALWEEYSAKFAGVLGEEDLLDHRQNMRVMVKGHQAGDFDAAEFWRFAHAFVGSEELRRAAGLGRFGLASEATLVGGARRLLGCKVCNPFKKSTWKDRKCFCACGNDGDPGDSCSASCKCTGGNNCEAGSQKCRAPGKTGEKCHATRPCDGGYSCHPGVHKCYNKPRLVGQPCSAGYGCKSGTNCHPGVHKCYNVPRRVDQPCSAGYKCDTGLYCLSGDQKCKLPGKVGETCRVPRKCETGLQCDKSDWKCKAYGNVGDRCHATRKCKPDYMCGTNMKCQYWRKLGQSCHATMKCMDGLQCESPKHKCVEMAKLGEGCHATKKCEDGLSCNFFTCVKWADYGDSCSAFRKCKEGLQCISGKHVCRYYGDIGDYCDIGNKCKSHLQCSATSKGLRCQGYQGVGDPCHLTLKCGTGLSCEAGKHKCVAPQGLGKACHATKPCRDGLYCEAFTHKCKGPGQQDAWCHLTRPCAEGYKCRGFKCKKEADYNPQAKCEDGECFRLINRGHQRPLEISTSKQEAVLADFEDDEAKQMFYWEGAMLRNVQTKRVLTNQRASDKYSDVFADDREYTVDQFWRYTADGELQSNAADAATGDQATVISTPDAEFIPKQGWNLILEVNDFSSKVFPESTKSSRLYKPDFDDGLFTNIGDLSKEMFQSADGGHYLFKLVWLGDDYEDGNKPYVWTQTSWLTTFEITGFNMIEPYNWYTSNEDSSGACGTQFLGLGRSGTGDYQNHCYIDGNGKNCGTRNCVMPLAKDGYDWSAGVETHGHGGTAQGVQLYIHYGDYWAEVAHQTDATAEDGLFGADVKTSFQYNWEQDWQNAYMKINQVNQDAIKPAVGDSTSSHYEFKLEYLGGDFETAGETVAQWTQTSWLTETAVSDYSKISSEDEDTADSCGAFAGLAASCRDSCVIDGMQDTCGLSTCERNCAAAVSLSSGAIPAWDGMYATGTRLYVKYFVAKDAANEESSETALRLKAPNGKNSQQWDLVPTDLQELYDSWQESGSPVAKMLYFDALAEDYLDVVIGESVSDFRENTPTVIKNIHYIAEALDVSQQQVGQNEVIGGAAQIAGGVLIFVGLALAPFTGGASAAMTLTAVSATMLGTALGIAGSVQTLSADLVATARNSADVKDASSLMASHYKTAMALASFVDEHTAAMDELANYYETDDGLVDLYVTWEIVGIVNNATDDGVEALPEASEKVRQDVLAYIGNDYDLKAWPVQWLWMKNALKNGFNQQKYLFGLARVWKRAQQIAIRWDVGVQYNVGWGPGAVEKAMHRAREMRYNNHIMQAVDARKAQYNLLKRMWAPKYHLTPDAYRTTEFARLHAAKKGSAKRGQLRVKYQKMSQKWAIGAGTTAAKAIQGVFAVVGIGFGIADVFTGADKLNSPHAFSERYRQGAELLELAAETALAMYDTTVDQCGSHGSNAGAVLQTAGASSACECQTACAALSACRAWTYVASADAWGGEEEIAVGVNNCILRSEFGAPEQGDCTKPRMCRSGKVHYCGLVGKNDGPVLETTSTETSCACNSKCTQDESCHGWTWQSSSQVCTLLERYGDVDSSETGYYSGVSTNMERSFASATVVGETTCTSGKYPSKEDCLWLGNSLAPADKQSATLKTVEVTHVPTGCSVRSGGDDADWQVFWNDYSGGKDSDKEFSVVCDESDAGYYESDAVHCPDTELIATVEECEWAMAELGRAMPTTSVVDSSCQPRGCGIMNGAMFFNSDMSAAGGGDGFRPVCKKNQVFNVDIEQFGNGDGSWRPHYTGVPTPAPTFAATVDSSCDDSATEDTGLAALASALDSAGR